MNNSTQRIYFIDFDHTLFDTDRYFHVDVKGRFLSLGIDIGLWERTYMDVCLSGYTLEKHVEAIHADAQQNLPLEAMRNIISEEFSALERYLFPDVMPFLRKAAADGAELAILSFGNPSWQRYKVRAAGIEPYFRHVFFTDRHSSKIEVIKENVGAGREIIFIDNHPNELDAAKDADAGVATFLINRVPEAGILRTLPENSFFEAKRYNSIAPRHQHMLCTNFPQILQTLAERR